MYFNRWNYSIQPHDVDKLRCILINTILVINNIYKRKQLIPNIKYTVKLYELRTNTKYIVSGDFPLGLVSFRVPSTVLSSHVVSMHPYNHHIFINVI